MADTYQQILDRLSSIKSKQNRYGGVTRYVPSEEERIASARANTLFENEREQQKQQADLYKQQVQSENIIKQKYIQRDIDIEKKVIDRQLNAEKDAAVINVNNSQAELNKSRTLSPDEKLRYNTLAEQAKQGIIAKRELEREQTKFQFDEVAEERKLGQQKQLELYKSNLSKPKPEKKDFYEQIDEDVKLGRIKSGRDIYERLYSTGKSEENINDAARMWIEKYSGMDIAAELRAFWAQNPNVSEEDAPPMQRKFLSDIKINTPTANPTATKVVRNFSSSYDAVKYTLEHITQRRQNPDYSPEAVDIEEANKLMIVEQRFPGATQQYYQMRFAQEKKNEEVNKIKAKNQVRENLLNKVIDQDPVLTEFLLRGRNQTQAQPQQAQSEPEVIKIDTGNGKGMTEYVVNPKGTMKVKGN